MKWDVEIQFSLAQKGIELWLVHVIPWNNSDSISLVMQHILKCSCLVNIGEAFHVDGSVAMWQLVLNKILLSNRLTAYPGTLKMTVLKKEQGQFFEENCWKHFLHHLFFFFFCLLSCVSRGKTQKVAKSLCCSISQLLNYKPFSFFPVWKHRTRRNAMALPWFLFMLWGKWIRLQSLHYITEHTLPNIVEGRFPVCFVSIIVFVVVVNDLGSLT